MKNKILIILTFAVIAIGSYALSAHRDYDSDDLIFGFIQSDEAFSSLDMTVKIETIGNLVDSQIWHYFHENGRIPVHIIVSAFCAFGGYVVFGIFNAIVAMLFVWLGVKYTFGTDSPYRHTPWTYLIAAIVFFYIFPRGLNSMNGPWFGIAIGVNYLWSAAAMLGTLLMLEKVRNGWQPRATATIGMCTLSLLTGWSNEAFSIPLSVALLVCLFSARHHNQLKYIRAIAFAVWIGTAVLVFAPATLDRASGQADKGLSWLIVSLAECYINVRLFWLFLITTLVLTACKKLSLKTFIKRNLIPVTIWSVGVIMSVYAHTMPHSLTCIELFSLILTVRALTQSSLYVKLSKLPPQAASHTVFIIIAIFLTAHLALIDRANIRALNNYHRELDSFRASPDGVYPLIEQKYSPIVCHFTNIYSSQNESGPRQFMISATFGVKDKLPFALRKADHENLIEHPEAFFTPANLMPGSAGMYDGDHFFVKPIGEADSIPTIIARYDSNTFKTTLPPLRRLFYDITGMQKDSKSLTSFIVHTRHGNYLLSLKTLSAASAIDIDR